MHVDFHGMKLPAPDTPLIEFETDDGEVVDLYNNCRLRATTFDADGLTFEFAGADSATIRLCFREVQRLQAATARLDGAVGQSDRPSAHSFGRRVASVRVQGRRTAL